ncbi:hypothetical protein BSL78_26992 [Apostichopus japonicus]|uniref:Fibronectin type-III domain-containing protein n=1 Tax=Stichopus japonicus TaxID=307972 RepID=A0A2G8JKE1_STIJA|nr:hypothetical protein BSL78_26992 [Apostichopus japonicus]
METISLPQGGNETGMFYSLSVSDEAYSMVCVRVALKTVGESEFSEAGCRRTRMARPHLALRISHLLILHKTAKILSEEMYCSPLAPKEANGIITGYRLTVWRTSNSTNLWEYHIPPNDTTTLVKGILSYQEYKAQLFAINAFGESDPSNVTITKVVTPNKAPLIIICTLVVLTIICCIMLTICLYSKIKKRVLPKVPEPVYYNDPFMTQLQCTHSIEPEVFDPLNSPPVETSTQIANGDAVTSEPAVGSGARRTAPATHTDDSRAVTARRYITAAKN